MKSQNILDDILSHCEKDPSVSYARESSRAERGLTGSVPHSVRPRRSSPHHPTNLSTRSWIHREEQRDSLLLERQVDGIVRAAKGFVTFREVRGSERRGTHIPGCTTISRS